MGVIDRYRDRLPVGPATPNLTLGEGSTPLVRSNLLSERFGVDLYFKCEVDYRGYIRDLDIKRNNNYGSNNYGYRGY